MTREEAKELLPMIKAFAEGKEIEYYDCNDDDWIKTDTPIWASKINYRIKPEPKYRPFETKEECWNEMLKHQPFGWLRDEDGDYILPATVGNKSDFIFRFKVYKFTDGTPFGIKEE